MHYYAPTSTPTSSAYLADGGPTKCSVIYISKQLHSWVTSRDACWLEATSHWYPTNWSQCIKSDIRHHWFLNSKTSKTIPPVPSHPFSFRLWRQRHSIRRPQESKRSGSFLVNIHFLPIQKIKHCKYIYSNASPPTQEEVLEKRVWWEPRQV